MFYNIYCNHKLIETIIDIDIILDILFKALRQNQTKIDSEVFKKLSDDDNK